MKRFIAFLFTLAVFASSCGGGTAREGGNETEPTGGKTESSIKEVIAFAKPATFTIYTFDEYGAPAGNASGFFIDENGNGITNYHVLKDAVKAIIKTSDGKEYEIDKVVASDDKWDVVKFSIKNEDGDSFDYLTFASSNENLSEGDKIYNISAPLGLEHSVSDGIISAIREDDVHGETIQVTAPISPGSSGSAILNEDGKVIAIATFIKIGGQNLNFGVTANAQKLANLEKKKNPFAKNNTKFNQKENFMIFNVPSDKDRNLILNAIEFKEDATIGYFSYTNLVLSEYKRPIWFELNKRDNGLYLLDRESYRKHFITSSSIGTNSQESSKVALASTYKFNVNFETVKNIERLRDIDIIDGRRTSGCAFTSIDVGKFRKMKYDTDDYQKDYAYALMRYSKWDEATDALNEILEKNPQDEQALNALGIIEFTQDNITNAEKYFNDAIKYHPNSPTAYINRCNINYRRLENYQEALSDINRAISIDENYMNNYITRAYIYMEMNNWSAAKRDLDKVLAIHEFKFSDKLYYYRAICNKHLKNRNSAKSDVEKAYYLTDDKDFEAELRKMYYSL